MHRLLHNLPVLLPPLPPVPHPKLFLPAATTNNSARKLFFFPQDIFHALRKGFCRTILAAGGVQTPARPCAICPQRGLRGRVRARAVEQREEKRKTQSCCPRDEGALGDVQEGKSKPGRAAKSMEWGEGQKAEKLSGWGAAAGQEAGAGLGVREILRFLLMPVPFSLFLLFEGKCF